MRAACVLVAATACFGGQPPPGEAPAAPIVFLVPNAQSYDCTIALPRYIGDVAIGSGSGYAVPLPYDPAGHGCGSTHVAVQAYAFDTMPGGDPNGTQQNDIGSTFVDVNGNDQPRIAVAGNTIATAPAGSGFVWGVVFDGTTTWSAMPTGTLRCDDGTLACGAVAPAHPSYPCCGSFGTQTTVPDTIHVEPGNTNVTFNTPPLFAHETMFESLVANSTTLFYVSRTGGPVAGTVFALPKLAGSSEHSLYTIDIMPGTAPVGIAATDAHVVWTVANDPHIDNGLLGPGCWIFDYPLPTGPAVQIFPANPGDTAHFSCMHAATDDMHVYFAIVSLQDGVMHGDGIGRVALSPDHTFESIRVGMQGAAAGPRRVYLDSDSIYAVDPEVIAKIHKDELTGPVEIAP